MFQWNKFLFLLPRKVSRFTLEFYFHFFLSRISSSAQLNDSVCALKSIYIDDEGEKSF